MKYQTSDLYVAAYLLTQKPSIQFEGMATLAPTIKAFTFTPKGACERAAMDYMVGGATVEAKKLAEATKAAKVMVHD